MLFLDQAQTLDPAPLGICQGIAALAFVLLALEGQLAVDTLALGVRHLPAGLVLDQYGAQCLKKPVALEGSGLAL